MFMGTWAGAELYLWASCCGSECTKKKITWPAEALCRGYFTTQRVMQIWFDLDSKTFLRTFSISENNTLTHRMYCTTQLVSLCNENICRCDVSEWSWWSWHTGCSESACRGGSCLSILVSEPVHLSFPKSSEMMCTLNCWITLRSFPISSPIAPFNCPSVLTANIWFKEASS